MFLGWLNGCAERAFFAPDAVHYDSPARCGLAFERVAFSSGDGCDLVGWFIPARGVSSAREARGTVIQLHGNAQNMTAHWSYLDWLPDRGWNLFVFDYRGYGDSTGTPTSEGVVTDSIRAIDAVRRRDDIDPSRLALIGQSLGGTNAIMATVEGDRTGIRALVIDSTFSSYASIAHEKVPLAGYFVRDRCSADRVVASIAPIPILFLHGTADRIVPSRHSEVLYALAKEPKTLVLIAGGEHTDAFASGEGDRWNGAYRDFVDAFLEAAMQDGSE